MAEGGLIRLRVTEHHHGPIFDRRADEAMREFANECEDEAADWALSHIRGTYHHSFRRPTGYYESHVHVSRLAGGKVVTDGGVIAYGPWLEGVGSRNNTTRFKGYHAFRKAAIALDRRMEEMSDNLLRRRYIRRVQ